MRLPGHTARVACVVAAAALIAGACSYAGDAPAPAGAQQDRPTQLACGVAPLILRDARSGTLPNISDARVQLVKVVARSSPFTDIAIAADDLVDAADEGSRRELKVAARALRDECRRARIDAIDAISSTA